MFPTLELEVSLCFLHQSVSCSWDKAGDREVCILFPTLEERSVLCVCFQQWSCSWDKTADREVCIVPHAGTRSVLCVSSISRGSVAGTNKTTGRQGERCVLCSPR